MERELSENDYVVYVWVDGIDTKVRLGHDDRLCRLPVMARRGRRARRSLWPFKTSTEPEGSWVDVWGSQKARDASSDFGRERRGVGLLGAQDGEHSERVAEGRA